MNRVDIAIVGGGVVGATLALALNTSGLRIALIESAVPTKDWPADSVDNRVFAITHASQRIFMALDVWPGIVAQRISPFREMHVWDSSGPGAIHFDSAEIGEGTLGYIAENRVLHAALVERLPMAENIEWLCPATMTNLERHNKGVTLSLNNGEVLEARLVVGADGNQSLVRKTLNIDTLGWEYDQRALVATVKTELPHRETAWQRFLPSGPLAFLPLNDGLCSIVWSATLERAQSLLALDDVTFCAELAHAFDHKLGHIESVGPRLSFPLILQHAQRYIDEHVALVGDAAHTVHPLAGQGINLGLLDAATLAEVIGDAHKAGKNFADISVLRRYERWRKGDNLLTLGVLDGFKRLFSSSLPPVNFARNVGMTLMNAISPVKCLIMQRATGQMGDLPKLAKGKLI